MASQDGIFKIKGTLGGVTFYKTKDGHLAREKGGIDKKRMAKDPAFKRTVKTEVNLAGPVPTASTCAVLSDLC